MTERAEKILTTLLDATHQQDTKRSSPEGLAIGLRAQGLRPSEAGWVLHHIFQIPMAQGVHLASICAGKARVVSAPEAPLPERLRDQVGNIHRIAA